MSNWNPRPLRPKDANPLFQQDERFVIKKSAELTPLQRQRHQDGTQHTRGSQYRISPVQATQSQGPTLYLEDVEKSVNTQKESSPPLNADDVVKSFLGAARVAVGAGKLAAAGAKKLKKAAQDEDEEDTEKAAKTQGVGATIGAAAGKVARTAGAVAGRVGSTVAGLASQR